MAKFAPDAMLDAGLDYVAGANIMHVCSGQPANYAGIAALSLADVAMAGGDFTKADDVSGRKVTVGAKSGVTIDASDDATHVVLANTGDSTLRYVTTCNLQALTAGGTVDFPAWKVNIEDPV